MGKSGEKSIEAEILSGQTVELNNDLMELLRKGMITNTGVPSAIINAFDEVDFSRTLVMQHTKYMARIISMQTELEAAVTIWYKKLMTMDSNISEQVINNFQFRFTRPKSLNTQNLVDMLGNTETLADFIVKMEVPDENNSELVAKVKQTVIKKVLLHGVINWKEYDDILEDAIIELHKEKNKKNITGDGTT